MHYTCKEFSSNCLDQNDGLDVINQHLQCWANISQRHQYSHSEVTKVLSTNVWRLESNIDSI